MTVAYNEYSYYYEIEKAFYYYENKGLGVFELKEGLDSPVDGVDLVDYSNVSFADIDGDGDLDALTSGSEVYDYYVYYCGCYYSSTLLLGNSIKMIMEIQPGTDPNKTLFRS
ncbi:MAG: VCBS repeat-containing protein [Flammeovirgaceae bacterium]|nr:VCBS repeat-containing protein [Flammeovirgaceae bacterium]